MGQGFCLSPCTNTGESRSYLVSMGDPRCYCPMGQELVVDSCVPECGDNEIRNLDTGDCVCVLGYE